MTKVELEIEFSGGIFFPEIVDYMNLTVCRSGDLPPRTLTRTFQIAACLCLRRPSRLLAPRAGSKLNMCPVHHDRPASSLGAAGAPRRPIRSVGLAPSSHRLTIAPRRRTARDSLNGIRRAWAASILSLHELSRRAFLCACTFRLPCRPDVTICSTFDL